MKKRVVGFWVFALSVMLFVFSAQARSVEVSQPCGDASRACCCGGCASGEECGTAVSLPEEKIPEGLPSVVGELSSSRVMLAGQRTGLEPGMTDRFDWFVFVILGITVGGGVFSVVSIRRQTR